VENTGIEVSILDAKGNERPTSFFAQPGILAGNFFTFLFVMETKPQVSYSFLHLKFR
jgi:hypothetical protein